MAPFGRKRGRYTGEGTPMARSFPRFVPSGEQAQEQDDPMLSTDQWIPR